MLSDPQSVTISGTTISLPRVASGDGYGRFTSADGTVVESVSHSRSGKNSTARIRHVFRLDHSKVAPDPLFPDQNAPYSMSSTLVVNVPVVGYTAAEILAVPVGQIAQLTASTNALLGKILGGEG